MPDFQLTATTLIAVWLAVVGVRYRNSTPLLLGGLTAVGLLTLASYLASQVELHDLGLAHQHSVYESLSYAIGWLILTLLYSPLADRIASRLVSGRPKLDAFRSIQRSRLKLILGIAAAWIFGGFLEELVLRAIVLQSSEDFVGRWVPPIAATGTGVLIASIGGFVLHLYQGLRAAVIIAQISTLFGILFVIAGGDLWAVVICHGLYDTIAFVRFATKRSKYSTQFDR